MENLIPFTIFGSGIAFGILLFALFIIFIFSDLNETGTTATIAFIIFIGINYFWGDGAKLLLLFTWKNILLYIFIGFIFSLVRTYFKGKELNKNKSKKENFDLKSSVFRWWFLFPISAINWIFGHLLKDAYDLVYSKIAIVYSKIFNA